MEPPIDMLTDDGYDLTFGTNVLGHFYLTKLLLPILISTAKSSPEGTVRVVNTSSVAHLFGNLQFDTFLDGPKRRADYTFRLYAQSKTVGRCLTGHKDIHLLIMHRVILCSPMNYTEGIMIKASSPPLSIRVRLFFTLPMSFLAVLCMRPFTRGNRH